MHRTRRFPLHPFGVPLHVFDGEVFPMMDPTAFSAAWVRDWNAHDLDAIVAHYAEDVVFRSPKVARYTGGKTDTLVGKGALRAYFARGLAFRTELHFSDPKPCWDGTGIALIYAGEDGSTAVETMTLDDDGLVAEARVFYDRNIEP